MMVWVAYNARLNHMKLPFLYGKCGNFVGFNLAGAQKMFVEWMSEWSNGWVGLKMTGRIAGTWLVPNNGLLNGEGMTGLGGWGEKWKCARPGQGQVDAYWFWIWGTLISWMPGSLSTSHQYFHSRVHAGSWEMFFGPRFSYHSKSSAFRTDRDIECGKSVTAAPQGGINQ